MLPHPPSRPVPYLPPLPPTDPLFASLSFSNFADPRTGLTPIKELDGGPASPSGTLSFTTTRPRFATNPSTNAAVTPTSSSGHSHGYHLRGSDGIGGTTVTSSPATASRTSLPSLPPDQPSKRPAVQPPPIPPRPRQGKTRVPAETTATRPDAPATASQQTTNRPFEGRMTMDAAFGLDGSPAPGQPSGSQTGDQDVVMTDLTAEEPVQALTNGLTGSSQPVGPEIGSSTTSVGTSAPTVTRKRPLPPRPHPPTDVPAWDPDTKAHIPPAVTLDSRTAAYTNLTNPPPRLRSEVERRQDPKRPRAGMLRRPAVCGVVVTGTDVPRSRRGGKDDVGIFGEWVLDPCIDSSLANARSSSGRPVRPGMPPKRSSRMTDRLKNRRKRGSADNVAPPTATFTTEKGNIDIRLAVVNQVMSAKGNGIDGSVTGTEFRGGQEGMFKDQVEVVQSAAAGAANAVDRHDGMARVQVETVRGHIRVELAEMDPDRSINLEVTSKHGMIFVLVPPTFRGPIQCSTPASNPTVFLPALRKRIEIIASDRGETVAYLGTKADNSTATIVEPRRMSDRLRSRPPSQFGSAGGLRGAGMILDDDPAAAQLHASPTRMDVDEPFHLPNPSSVADVNASSFIPALPRTPRPTARQPPGPAWLAASSTAPQTASTGCPVGPESSLFISSYSSSVTVGLYGLESPIPRATGLGGLGNALNGLMAGLEEVRAGVNRAVEGRAAAVSKGKGRSWW